MPGRVPRFISRWVDQLGAGLDVTDGTTTVTGATRLSLPAGTVTDEGAGVAGVAVQTRLIGPVAVPFDHPDIAGNFGMVRISQLGPGVTVTKFWAVMTEAWTGTVTELHLAISDTSDGNSVQDLSVLALDFNDTSPSPQYAREITAGKWGAFADALVNYVGVAGPSGAWLLAYFGVGTKTNGTVDVYALTATPV